jgi:hypothetical protein
MVETDESFLLCSMVKQQWYMNHLCNADEAHIPRFGDRSDGHTASRTVIHTFLSDSYLASQILLITWEDVCLQKLKHPLDRRRLFCTSYI